jgi:uncharacterized protein YdaU (DUF1376 family)
MKDPAFLFYPNDWLGGTMGMSFEEKGAYMELLMMQFNRGHMSSHMCGHVVGHLWVNIKDKFKQDENGLWFNKRLEDEQFKRKAFTQSRRNNVNGKNQYSNRAHMTSHMTSHMENENKDVNDTINKEPAIFKNLEKQTDFLKTGQSKDRAHMGIRQMHTTLNETDYLKLVDAFHVHCEATAYIFTNRNATQGYFANWAKKLTPEILKVLITGKTNAGSDIFSQMAASLNIPIQKF